MVRITVRYLVKRPRKNGWAYYWQPTRDLLDAGFIQRRLPDDWAEAVHQAELLNARLDQWRKDGTKPSTIIPGTLAHFHARFQLDDDFKAMRDRTQADYLRNIKPALAWAGDQAPEAITRTAAKAWYRLQRETHGVAQSRHQFAALSRLLTFCMSEDAIPENPCHGLRITLPEPRRRVWTLAERDTFMAAAVTAGRPSMALAVLLGWWLGQRPADLRTLAWTAYDGETIQLRQAKTGAVLRVPVDDELRVMLDGVKRTSTQIVVSEATKRPYHESAFQHLFAEIRAFAWLPPDLQFRDLRATLATRLGTAGASGAQIRAMTGHTTDAMLAIYVRPDTAMARAGMDKLKGKG